MSLPPKLLERLKKRGIIQQTDEPQSKRPCDTELKRQSSVIGCPNKCNVFHDCTTYCELKYGLGMEMPTPKLKQIYDTLIENYPLDPNWQSIWEPSCARFYFYNIHTNLCSWWPPGHPKFKSNKSANALRAERDNADTNNSSDSKLHEQSDNKISEELDRFEAELNSELEQNNVDDQLDSCNEKSNRESSDDQSNESNNEHDEEQSDEESDLSRESYEDRSSDEN